MAATEAGTGKNRNSSSDGANQAGGDGGKTQQALVESANAGRETIESVVIAIILAFLFRSFIGEAFVIPTGSMAPTLRGNHKDVVCEKCKYAYQANASSENDDHWSPDLVVATTCPLCRYTMTLDWDRDVNHKSFTGDRILVSKFAYDLQEPQRWDVIVFKYPNNAKQNYIKRLVGLPGEILRVRHGDVFVKQQGAQDFTIARKPPHKIKAMLQVVDDSKYLADDLIAAKWPSRWQPWRQGGSANDGTKRDWRTTGDDREPIALDGSNGQLWLRYRHLVPEYRDWLDLEEGQKLELPPAGDDVGQLVTDFYAYNSLTTKSMVSRRGTPQNHSPELRSLGNHWVGDLAFEGDIETKSSDGTLLLELVEGGAHYVCRIDLATGDATLSIENADYSFKADSGNGASDKAAKATPVGKTAFRGGRRHQVRFSNVDDELRLWVDEKLIEFDGPTTFESPAMQRPIWTASEPGDLAPVGVGAERAQVTLHRLRVLRDVYYVATRAHLPTDFDYEQTSDETEIQHVLRNPKLWASHTLFDTRRYIEFPLEKDQFFPMGDNSPQSKDGRLWGEPAYVERELLTGKAVLVYWPHSWNDPPLLPNFKQMRLIR